MAEFKQEKEFKRGYEFKEPVFNPILVPGINVEQIDQDISIQT